MPVFKCERKVQRFGSSYAITIPALYVKLNEVRKGSLLNIIYNTDNVMIVSKVRPEKVLPHLEKLIRDIEEKILEPNDEQ